MGKNKIKIVKQLGENTCWEAAAKMILKYIKRYEDAEYIIEKQDDEEASAARLVADFLGYWPKDESQLPNWTQLTGHIGAGGIYLSLVADKPFVPDAVVKGGHWIIVNGYEGRDKLYIVDPGVGREIERKLRDDGEGTYIILNGVPCYFQYSFIIHKSM